MRLVFMGTPDFAVPSLDILVKNGYDIAAVITAPDKPAGRGQQLREPPVKQYAVKQGFNVLQPEKLKNPAFIASLQALKADLFIVVAFRMLPEAVWSMPPKGTFNLHASLLPQYRGAAPINWVLINGENQTGVTTFQLRHEIDTGLVLFREETGIGPDENAGELHDRLMQLGARLVLKTVQALEQSHYHPVSQDELMIRLGLNDQALKPAPKIFKEDCRISWERPAHEIHNFIRGLSPYPTAFTTLDGKILKIFRARIQQDQPGETPGTCTSDNSTWIRFAAKDGYIYPLELQLEGKKRMRVEDFLRGYRV